MTPSPSSTRNGAIAAVGAFLGWGISPLYFKALSSVAAWDMLSNRIAWSVLLTGLAVLLTRRWPQAEEILFNRRKLRLLALSALMIAINWILFIWSVTHGQALQASMGYFLFPLVSVLLGAIFLKEKLKPRQIASLVLVAAGVGSLMVSHGDLPWIALTLAGTFGLYGLLRKIAPADALVGLFIETLVLAPAAIAYLIWLGGGAFVSQGPHVALMLLAAGPVTTIPLVLFAIATRRMRLATVGLLQYINPTVQMLLAVLVFGEAFTTAHLITFLCIWSGLLIYSTDVTAVVRHLRRA